MARKRSNKQVNSIVESEGLGYAVEHYLDANSIADPELSKLWATAADALKKISTILEQFDED